MTRWSYHELMTLQNCFRYYLPYNNAIKRAMKLINRTKDSIRTKAYRLELYFIERRS